MLGGWGNFPVEPCHVSRPDTTEALRTVVMRGRLPDYIPRGLGRAYGDSALNRDRGVICQTRRNRFLGFDTGRGILECEAGVSFQDIIDVFLPRGWFLPTTPGTKYITVGGAIAADVHGKNHHGDGSFGNFVLDLQLLTAGGEVLACSAAENADLFWATIGGMGLTGCILSARFRLVRVESAYVDVTYRRTANLDETLECFDATNRDYRYSVAWIDCLASGAALGRSVLMLANDAPRTALPRRWRDRPLLLPRRGKKAVPFHCPAFPLNHRAVRLFNAVYYASHPNGRQIVDYDTFFYPLDHVLAWNRIYGRRGFVQYQALLPPATSRQGLIRLLETISASRKASFLAVLKSTGRANKGFLSFPCPGHTLALDLPNTGQDLRLLLRQLDDLVLAHGGRLYLAKDALATPEVFQAMYPALGRFRQVKARFDPNHRFVSSQARRLGIVEAS
jgi:FAD/FMN-containing dehydrogenase